MNEHLHALKAYNGIPVLVIGASGFIGRWVARHLELAGAETTLAVRDQTSAAEIFGRYGIHGRVIRLDLLERDLLKKTMVDIKPAIVFNLAGYGVDRSERDETTAYHINKRTIEELCESIDSYEYPDWPGRRIVHAGSALEYGIASGDLNEMTEPAPTTLYGRSKLAGTRALADISRQNNIQSVTARLFTIYGPGEHPGRLLPALIETAATRKPIDLTDGRQLRDFTYVEDAAEGMLRLGMTSGPPGEIVNLATGRLTAVREFVRSAAEILNLPDHLLRIGALPTRTEEMKHDPVSVERLKKLTGWSPHTSVAEGIRRTIDLMTSLNCPNDGH
ncbi:MAG: NAD-dependent epimerase/dehydratase family protein [Blastocatellales bacterium]